MCQMNIDIIGDIHGCFAEFRQLTEKMGWYMETGVPVHPSEGFSALSGDLTDRGPNSLQVIEVVHELVINQNIAGMPQVNHCNKLYRYFSGNKYKYHTV